MHCDENTQNSIASAAAVAVIYDFIVECMHQFSSPFNIEHNQTEEKTFKTKIALRAHLLPCFYTRFRLESITVFE